MFCFKWKFGLWVENVEVSTRHALKFDLASRKPRKRTSLHKNTRFELKYSFMRRSVRAVRELEKDGKKDAKPA